MSHTEIKPADTTIHAIARKIYEEVNKPFDPADKNQREYKFDTHFPSGENLHGETYYFAKRFFQNDQNCDDVSTLIADKLILMGMTNSVTLVSYGNYTTLALKKTIDKCNLRDDLFHDINYAILEKYQDTYDWQYTPTLKNNVVIIIPITCTYSSFTKLYDYIHDYDNTKSICRDCIAIFVILHEDIQDKIESNDTILPANKEENTNGRRNYDKTLELYKSFYWESISKNKIEFSWSDGRKDPIGSYPLILLYARLYLPELCEKCFPEKAVEDKDFKSVSLTEEEFLFPTHDNYETPNLIFDFPNFDAAQNADAEEFYDMYIGTHLYAHTAINGYSYLSYIKANAFYEQNKDRNKKDDGRMQKFFGRILEQIPDKDIIFITSDDTRNSNFLEDLISLIHPVKKTPTHSEDKTPKSKLTVLRFQPAHGFIDNFISIHGDLILGGASNDNQPMLIYFEEVLSGGRTLKLISDYIKHLKREQDSSSEPRSSFELVITLIDRTSMHTKNEILRKLPIDNNKFISFTRLNVPIISAAQVGDPLKKRIESLKKMMHHTLWDSLKVTIGNEVSKKTPKVLEDVLNKSLEVTTPPYFPFKNEGIIDEKTYETYKRKYNQEHLDLLKLFLADYINNNIKKHSNNSDNIKGLIDGTYEAIQATVANFFVDTQNTNNSRDEGTEKQIVRDLIFKILCRPPFIYYHDIYEAVFQYCIEKLENIRRNWESKEKISFEEFRQLKFFIRRSVELNSNFILSKKFITCIRDHYQKIAIIGEEDQPELNDGEMIYEHVKYKKKQIESFPYFLMYSYKLLISRSPTKSIHLESIINSHDLLPRQITEPENTDQELKELLRDTYYCLLGMIKAENIYLLSDLKDYHKGKKNRFNNVDEIREYYFHTATNVPQIINAQKLIGNSRYGLDNTQEVEKNKGIRQIQLAVSHMLNTVSVLKTNNSTKPNSNSIDFDDNIRAILDSLIKILQPDDDNKSQLHYALCIEYKKQSQDRNPNEYIYTVSSNYSVSQDADEIRLSEDGIINNLLRGLYDTPDCSHVQTFLTAVRLGDEVVSFASNYYRSGYANPISFKEAYNKDRDANFHTLKNAKMTLFIRLADLIEENDKKGNPLFNLEGQAVLVIASSEPAKTSSFIRLMSNENLRLLLLLKTDLLEYLYKQFENDAFIEVLESRKRENSNKKLRHGIIRYIRDQSSIYNTICEEIIQYTKDNLITSNDQLDNYDEHTRSRRENYMLPLNIIDDAIRTQFSFRQQIDKLKKGVELPEEYEQEKVRERIECILKYPCFGGWSADPNDENIADKIEIRGFNEQKKIVLHPSIFKVVIPELIINIKKYTPRFMGNDERYITINYNSDQKTLFFENTIAADTETTKNANRFGLKMCKDIIFYTIGSTVEGDESFVINKTKKSKFQVTIKTL